MKRATFASEAADEMVLAAAHYYEQKEGLEISLLAQVKAATNRVMDRPGMYAKVAVVRGVAIRRAIVRKFPYSIIYIELDAHRATG